MFRLAVIALLAVAATAADLVTKTDMGSNTHFMVDWRKGSDVKYDMEDVEVGDMITFKWTEWHDAVIVPAVADPCALRGSEDKYTKILSEAMEVGEVNYTVTSPVSFWVICTVCQHCALGNQKIMFMIDGSHSSNGTVSVTNSTMNPNSTMTMTPPRAPMTTNGSRSSNGVEAKRATLSSIFGFAFLAVLFG